MTGLGIEPGTSILCNTCKTGHNPCFIKPTQTLNDTKWENTLHWSPLPSPSEGLFWGNKLFILLRLDLPSLSKAPKLSSKMSYWKYRQKITTSGKGLHDALYFSSILQEYVAKIYLLCRFQIWHTIIHAVNVFIIICRL